MKPRGREARGALVYMSGVTIRLDTILASNKAWSLEVEDKSGSTRKRVRGDSDRTFGG